LGGDEDSSRGLLGYGTVWITLEWILGKQGGKVLTGCI